MTTSVTVRHNFETAHRLPELGGKCVNLHGHSWWVEVSVTSVQAEKMSGDGELVCEFGALKAELRAWIDTRLDHATMLGTNDPLVGPLLEQGCKVFLFGGDLPAADLPWPTVEATATLLARVAANIAAELDPALVVTRVRVQETHVNAAEVEPACSRPVPA
jgi:6-pyruvoyltetrahydropterin/6-carboxytetrahydropterin synthase